MRFLFILLILPVMSYAQLQTSTGTYADKITLSWTKVDGAQFYNIERIHDAPQLTKRGKKIPFEPTFLTQTSALSYTDLPAPPGRQKYIVTAVDTNGTNIQTFEAFAWRQVTDQEFFLEFQKSIDSSLPRIRTMKMLNFIGEKVRGWRDGRLVYKTSGIFRRPIRITITYTNFIDQYLSLTGEYQVQIFKIIGQKGKLVGTINVDGIYKGKVTHDLVLKKGQSSDGGVYHVQQEGKAEAILPWNVTEHPLDDSKYEKNLKSTLNASDEKEDDNTVEITNSADKTK